MPSNALPADAGHAPDSMPTDHPKSPRAARATPTARGPGRPRKAKARAVGRPAGDSQDLRERLLDVAVECFAHHGIASATLREIAREAGVNPALVQSLLEHIRGLRAEGRTVVFVEHDMDVVMSISDRVVCMAEGRVIADGTGAEVVANQAVVDAYLGQRRGRAAS